MPSQAATQHRSLGSSSVPSSRVEENLQVNANATVALRNAPLQMMDDDEQMGSDGTLMLDKGGRSKYLGPTAGSEWLKDVCDSYIQPLVMLIRCSQKCKKDRIVPKTLVLRLPKSRRLRLHSNLVCFLQSQVPTHFLLVLGCQK